MISRCAECGCDVALWRAVTAIRVDAVILTCPECAAESSAASSSEAHVLPTAVPLTTAPPELSAVTTLSVRDRSRAVTSLRPPRRLMRTAAVVAAAAITVGLAAHSQKGTASTTSTTATPQLSATPPSVEPVAEAPPAAPDQSTLTVVEPAAVPADPNRWVYPLPGLPEKWETTRLGTFGSKRDGRRPHECRRGHCGVDLHGPRGMPVVAVVAGIVDRVHASRRGKGGRYVELLHDDGSRTYYMHLDHVRRSLRVGTEVVAGEALGTLGRSGIRTSPAHLHFAWKLARGNRGRYRNPAGHLSDARMIERADSRGVQELPIRRTKKARHARRRPRS